MIAAQSMKPLFIPLKSEFYDEFLCGDKREELRLYGPRWNERTCQVGREVILSKGYGKQHRTCGVIMDFTKQHGTTFGSTHKESIVKCYGTLEVWIARIGIETGVWADFESRECDNTL